MKTNLLEHDRTLRIIRTMNGLVIALCLVRTVNTHRHMRVLGKRGQKTQILTIYETNKNLSTS